MPCYTTREYAVNLGKLNRDVLVAGLKAAGWIVTATEERVTFQRDRWSATHAYTVATGELKATTEITAETTNQIKVAYARAALTTAAARMGWLVNKTAQDNRLRLTRRF